VSYYARCIEDGYKYLTREYLTKTKACPGCGNNTTVLAPQDDVYIQPNWSALLELCAYALQKAEKTAANKGMERGPKVVMAIRKRLVAQRKKSPVTCKINWHELEILGWWATQFLCESVEFDLDKFMGPNKRVHLYLFELTQKFPSRKPLAASIKMALDKLAKWQHDYVAPNKVVSDEAIAAFPIEQAPPLLDDVPKIILPPGVGN
jgi:hypothetical protein